jgi:SSS family solute:Na+ symporter
MSYFSIDHLIVYGFLILTLGVGLWACQGVKNVEEYALANRQFGSLSLLLTLLACEVGGAMIFRLPMHTRLEGILWPLLCLWWVVDASIMAFVIAPRMGRFRGCLSLGDIIKLLYGPTAGVIAGLLAFCVTLCLAGRGLFMLGTAAKTLLGIQPLCHAGGQSPGCELCSLWGDTGCDLD